MSWKKDETISRIPRFVHLRKHELIQEFVSDLLKESQFADFLSILEDFKKNNYPHEPRLARGKIRDAIIHLLDLHDVDGIDADFAIAFKDVSGNSIKEIRENAIPIASKLLASQIETGNTFFLNAEKIASSVYAHLVGGLIQARTNEIAKLGKKASVKRVIETYYGYKIVMTSMLAIEGRGGHTHGIPDEASEVIKEITGDLGTSTLMSSKYQSLGSASQFEKCSDYHSRLLSNMMKALFVKSVSSKRDAIISLGGTGDIRAWDVVQKAYFQFSEPYDRASVLSAIGAIGSSEAVSLLRSAVRYAGEASQSAISAIGQIGSEEAFETLKKLANGSTKSHRVPAIRALGICSNDEKVEDIGLLLERSEDLFEKRSAIIALAISGPRGRQKLIQEFPKYCNSFLRNNPDTALLLEYFVLIPGIYKTNRFAELVANLLGSSHRFHESLGTSTRFGHPSYQSKLYGKRQLTPVKIIKILRNCDAIWRSPKVIGAILMILKNSKSPGSVFRELTFKELLISTTEFQDVTADLLEESRLSPEFIRRYLGHHESKWDSRVMNALSKAEIESIEQFHSSISKIAGWKDLSQAMDTLGDLLKYTPNLILNRIDGLIKDIHEKSVLIGETVIFTRHIILYENPSLIHAWRTVILELIHKPAIFSSILESKIALEDEEINKKLAEVFLQNTDPNSHIPFEIDHLLVYPWFIQGIANRIRESKQLIRFLLQIVNLNGLVDIQEIIDAIESRRDDYYKLLRNYRHDFGLVMRTVQAIRLLADDPRIRKVICSVALSSDKYSTEFLDRVSILMDYDDIRSTIEEIGSNKKLMRKLKKNDEIMEKIEELRKDGFAI